ncbi:PspC domain-containing protein [Ornithinimicrobium sufpigmenti]|uniref:PspC domain-containing protein n=1 Tax=Ornithinimicrobium sufpigmenti TaxID=2508882 RepID=UPI0015E1A524|nr:MULTISPECIES: PspC domain-containing protein [unclassified Ornithinimicrobium]
MNEHLTSSSPLDLGPTPGSAPDGGPPPLPGPVLTGPMTGHRPTGDGPEDASPAGDGATGFHRLFAILRRSPVRRDGTRGVLGGLCAGIARSTGLSVVAVRVIAVAAAFLPGTVVGAYLLAWALLPDEDGGIHAERALCDGRPRSLVILGLGAIALLGVLSWVLNTWPLLVAAGLVALVLFHQLGGSQGRRHPSA